MNVIGDYGCGYVDWLEGMEWYWFDFGDGYVEFSFGVVD